MEYIAIIGTDLEPSRIGLGTWAIGGWMWGGANDAAAIQTIQRALDLGITLIDTAPAYGQGHSEEIVGRALHGRRAEAIIATKAGLEWDDKVNVTRNASAKRIHKEVEDSLRRLQTDYIDIYQLHWPDQATPIEETAGALQKLFDAGKILAVGVSNFSIEQMNAFRQYTRLHTVQPPFNLFERQAEEDVLPYAGENGIAALTYGALCRGLLGGAINEDTRFEGDDLRRVDPKFQQPRFGQYVRAVKHLDELAHRHYGKRVIHLALRWVLEQPNVSVALWGARRPDQLDALPDAMDFAIDKETLAEIDSIIREYVTDPVGPEFMAPPEAARA